MDDQLELTHLRYAIAAVEHRSFRRAAEALGVKPSSVSRAAQRMEKQLGVAIFQRSSSGVSLTEVGMEILRSSRHVVEVLDHMTATARSIATGKSGRLTIGFYTSVSAGNLRSCLLEFRTRFPDISVTMADGPKERLYAGIQDGRIDVAIVTGEPVGGPSKSRSMSLWNERILVALPDKHDLADNSVLYWTDMRDETFLFGACDPDPELQSILFAKLARPSERPTVINHDLDREKLKCVVGAGFGLTLICEAGAGATFPGVVYREVRDGHGPSQISYAAHWSADNSNPALKRFIALLEERHPRLSGAS